jgi:sodium transport system ATP-binding protein
LSHRDAPPPPSPPPAAPAPLVQAVGLRREFDGVVAVAGLDLEVAAGEIYGLIGPNGAGKTTTLRMLAALLRPTAGHAAIAGVDVAADPLAAKRALGFLTGSTGLYARLTVRELCRYFGTLYGLRGAPLARRVDELAAAFGFTRLLDRRCGGLSTGERQRVSVARAVVHDPPVLILDEPTAGLDVIGSRFIHDFVHRAAAGGKAVLFSTHYLAEAQRLCHRIGLLDRGRLIAEGPPRAILDRVGVDTLEEAFLALVAPPAAPAAPAAGDAGVDAEAAAAPRPAPPTADGGPP